MKTISLVFSAVVISLASGCASRANVSSPISVSVISEDLAQVKPGESYIELKPARPRVARAELATSTGRPNTRFSCGSSSCSQGHIVTH